MGKLRIGRLGEGKKSQERVRVHIEALAQGGNPFVPREEGKVGGTGKGGREGTG